MLKRFDDLLFTSPHDGATAPIGVHPFSEHSEVDVLMEAWFLERQGAVENELYLKEARALLHQILAEGILSPSSRRKSKTLLRAIDDSRRARSGPSA